MPTQTDLLSELYSQVQSQYNDTYLEFLIGGYNVDPNTLNLSFMLHKIFNENITDTRTFLDSTGVWRIVTNKQLYDAYVQWDTMLQIGNELMSSIGSEIVAGTITQFADVDTAVTNGFSTATARTNLEDVRKLLNPTIGTVPGISIVSSTSAGGTQLNATKNGVIFVDLGDSVTTTIGGTSTEDIVLEVCSTNSATAAAWQVAGEIADGNTITLALALQSVQPGKRQLVANVPAGWYFRVREASSAGTHSASINGIMSIIYG